MSAIKLEQFGGMLPAWSDRLLPAGQASSSQNAYLFSGELRGWRQPKLLRSLSDSAAKFAFRVPINSKSAATAKLTFNGQPADGEVLTLGEETYTFVTGPVTTAYQVLIGATALDTANNLFGAFTFDVGAGTNAGTNYGLDTLANPIIDQTGGVCYVDAYATPFIMLKAEDTGAAYNTTRLTTTASNIAVTAFSGGTNISFDPTITGSAVWLEFLDQDTDVVRSPIVDDKYNRYYVACPSAPPTYNTYDRIAAGKDPFLLGLQPPGCAPTVEVSGGGSSAILGFPNSINAGVTDLSPNSLYVIPVTPGGAMEINDVSFMPTNTDAVSKFAAVIYSDLNGAPDTLLDVGVVQQGWAAGTAAVSAFLTPAPVLQDVQYWIGVVTDGDVQIQNGDNNSNAKTHSTTWTNGPPAIFPSSPSAAQDVQLWGDFTTSSVLSSRAYVYTWLSEYLEESPPSPATLVNGWSNGTWTIGLYTPPPADMGVDRNIKQLRLYRTVPGVSGQTEFYWVADLDVGTAQYVDTQDDATIALNTILPSTNWFPPPEGMVAIQSMPNGMLVGFKGNEIWFSEPYHPHAWPPGYVITTEFPIVGLGVTGHAVVAATSSTPYVAQGVNPQSISLDKVQSIEPCTSRGSIVSNDQGVFYTSPNGLIQVTQSGVCTNITEQWITRERWQQLTPQTGQHAIPLHGCYFCYSTDTSTGFLIELAPGDANSFTIWPQPGGHRVGFTKLTAPNGYPVDHIQIDPWSGVGMVIQNGGIYYYDFTDPAPAIMPYKWRSKKLQQKSLSNYSAMKVYFDIPAGIGAQSAARSTAAFDDPVWNTLAAGQYGIVRVFADDRLVTVREIRTSGELLRIASGFKCATWMWEFEGYVNISNVQVATTVKELGTI